MRGLLAIIAFVGFIVTTQITPCYGLGALLSSTMGTCTGRHNKSAKPAKRKLHGRRVGRLKAISS
jgi:hypothetical protein